MTSVLSGRLSVDRTFPGGCRGVEGKVSVRFVELVVPHSRRFGRRPIQEPGRSFPSSFPSAQYSGFPEV